MASKAMVIRIVDTKEEEAIETMLMTKKTMLMANNSDNMDRYSTNINMDKAVISSRGHLGKESEMMITRQVKKV